MPTCPGCQQRVSHGRLDTHERYCHALHGGDASDHEESTRRLEERLDEVDRRVDRRLRALEASVGNHSPGSDNAESDLTLLERDW